MRKNPIAQGRQPVRSLPIGPGFLEPGVPLILSCPRDLTYPDVKPNLDILSTPRNHCASVAPFERRIHILAGPNIVCC